MVGRFRSALCSGVILLALAPVGAFAQPAAPAQSPAVATPRMPDGKPDLNGVWTGTGGGNARQFDEETDTGSNNVGARNGRMANYENDNGLTRLTVRNRPLYKPQFWDTVRSNDWNGNKIDPETHCRPAGVPRVGQPMQIMQTMQTMQTKDRMMFTYQASVGMPNVGFPRIFFHDGRPQDPVRVSQESWNGAAIGHWEGDTLVVVTTGFTDESWLSKSGYFHGYQLKVTERLTRKGNEILYEVTIEDPEHLTQPWVLYPRTMRLNTSPNAYLEEALPCDERDREDMVGHNRGGGGSQMDPGPRRLFGIVIPSTATR